jgi:hypothetical protein
MHTLMTLKLVFLKQFKLASHALHCPHNNPPVLFLGYGRYVRTPFRDTHETLFQDNQRMPIQRFRDSVFGVFGTPIECQFRTPIEHGVAEQKFGERITTGRMTTGDIYPLQDSHLI